MIIKSPKSSISNWDKTSFTNLDLDDGIYGIIPEDVQIHGQCWDWRIINAFQLLPHINVIGLSFLDQNRKLNGYWYSSRNRKNPYMQPQLYPIQECRELGIGPLFFRSHLDIKHDPELKTAHQYLMYNNEIKASIAIPFEQFNLYV